ncbi:probable oxidoreductase (short-chain dehydrogenase family) [Natronomonas moolapensis 8.8.11]|uniref:Probable oxidoreductase (Short-chain dehydrogenase family) n=1 Tax=Natronomonas moolapensis (strain DSM 18674 / CECT 7526 / JCM 14361 / 8.8.11) TaxID=268739 RepID=M1XRU7_NATM8|nr:SDR family NAD(P)-dependent oxidoreductase [Natronomonas moolapensis]CCQ36976.1 probable oxidoreductase (short-chain dehydrogenase family) [Natronomonas moolapensis 8.8.11]
MSDTTAALEGQVALVTGASSGIGRATAAELAAAGASVALAARREGELETLAREIESEGGEALVVPTDVTDEEQLEAMIETTVAEFGSLDVLVNNAGVMLLEAVADADTDNWRQMIEVNLLAVMNATHAALPVMREQGRGHVVNVSSVAGRQAIASASGYNATKFGVNGFTEAFRQEVAEDGIRTTLIEPGIVDTELQEHIPDEEIKRETEAWVDSLDPLTGQDIAETIRFAATRPPHVSVNELLVRPTQQEM